MSKGNRKRHKFCRFVTSITEHHTLITGTVKVILVILIILKFIGLINAHSNIGRLMVESGKYGTGIAVKTFLCIVITDVNYSLTNDRCNINICFSCNLTHNKNLTCCTSGFAGNTAHRILLKHGIKNCVRNLVANLIGMSLCNRFAGK